MTILILVGDRKTPIRVCENKMKCGRKTKDFNERWGEERNDNETEIALNSLMNCRFIISRYRFVWQPQSDDSLTRYYLSSIVKIVFELRSFIHFSRATRRERETSWRRSRLSRKPHASVLVSYRYLLFKSAMFSYFNISSTFFLHLRRGKRNEE